MDENLMNEAGVMELDEWKILVIILATKPWKFQRKSYLGRFYLQPTFTKGTNWPAPSFGTNTIQRNNTRDKLLGCHRSGMVRGKRSGKSQGILFLVRENWHFEEKPGKIGLQFYIPLVAERNISLWSLLFLLFHFFVKTIAEMP